MTTKEKVYIQIDKINEIQNTRNQKHYDWLRNLLTIAIAFLGLIVSLKTDKIENQNRHLAFSFTILLLSFGILCGSIALYTEVHLLNRLRKCRMEYAQGLLDGNNNQPKVKAILPKKFYVIAEYTCFFSFGLSLCSLVIYTFLENYN